MIKTLVPLSPERIRHIKLALWGVLISWSLAALMACGSLPRQADGSLYEQLGGRAGIELVVGKTLDRVANDPRSKRSFAGIKMPHLKRSVTDYVCKLADGPCEYEGETMANAHAQSKNTAAEFDFMVTVLREELNKAGVSEAAKNELLRRLAPTRRGIVQGS